MRSPACRPASAALPPAFTSLISAPLNRLSASFLSSIFSCKNRGGHFRPRLLRTCGRKARDLLAMAEANAGVSAGARTDLPLLLANLPPSSVISVAATPGSPAHRGRLRRNSCSYSRSQQADQPQVTVGSPVLPWRKVLLMQKPVAPPAIYRRLLLHKIEGFAFGQLDL